MNTYKATWSGKYPNLCSGEWKLYKNEEDITHLIPEERRGIEMDTLKSYKQWSFTRDYEVKWKWVNWGLNKDEWIEENKEWLDKITDSYEEKELIFLAFNEQDWTLGSCGGCI